MFDDVPPLLTAFVEALLDPMRGDFRYAQAAAIVTAFYLKEPVERRLHGQKFFRLETTPSGQISPHHFAKVMAVGETLFLLRNCKGFETLCRKLETRDLEAEYFALLTARQFVNAGFEVSARDETGIKEMDFDFDATRNGETLNIEATRIGNEEFSSKVVLNRLKKKRAQIPRGIPAVLFCEHSPKWFDRMPHVETVLRDVTQRFFRTTTRINAVVYMVQSYIGYSEGYGALNTASLTFLNENATYQFSDWRFLIEGRYHSTVVPSPDLTAFARSGEFYKWVDHITERLKNGARKA